MRIKSRLCIFPQLNHFGHMAAPFCVLLPTKTKYKLYQGARSNDRKWHANLQLLLYYRRPTPSYSTPNEPISHIPHHLPLPPSERTLKRRHHIHFFYNSVYLNYNFPLKYIKSEASSSASCDKYRLKRRKFNCNWGNGGKERTPLAGF